MVADVPRVCGLAIIGVTDGVADAHEESIVNDCKTVMSTTKNLWVILGQLGICAAVAELSCRH